jgi:hypothetical protein
MEIAIRNNPHSNDFYENRANERIAQLEERSRALEGSLAGADKRYQQRFDAQEKAVDYALTAQQTAVSAAFTAQEKATSAAMAASKEAITKAEAAAEKEFEAANNVKEELGRHMMPREEILRALMGIEARQNVTDSAVNQRVVRAENYELLKNVTDRLETLSIEVAAKENMDKGRGAGFSTIWVGVIGGIAMLSMIVNMFLLVLKATGH